jgi:outer membrane protease
MAGDEIKVGVLGGYRYEKFNFEMYDIYYPDYGITLFPGVKVGTYKISYSLPYLGLATTATHENFGVDIGLKYSFSPTAKHLDHHLLRDLTGYADYDRHGYAFMYDIVGFWNFKKNWKFKFGVDGTSISIDGKHWEEKHDPGWDKDISTDAQHWIIWSGIDYKF